MWPIRFIKTYILREKLIVWSISLSLKNVLLFRNNWKGETGNLLWVGFGKKVSFASNFSGNSTIVELIFVIHFLCYREKHFWRYMKKNLRQEQIIVTCPTYQVSSLPVSEIIRKTPSFLLKKKYSSGCPKLSYFWS